ncbi:succinyl-CoA synthetase, beta subunit [Methanoregula boonei 6A8]|uniref:Succinyl-CoA synthetase, beta subunit n=1 Tax=Methanoregula boonei (strain DSM 21154 / JCM 14090 / 6A8) TaxID=456442 RepID=A7I684_METB6|nr:ATP-grasp domain-containing protein [Methanoregula boonei]ABS55245.1 succinyl-CoA synthetase, beta subunit [Methanoregula boonei 6A8]
MKLLEYEAKQLFSEEGIRVPKGILVGKHEEILLHMDAIPAKVAVKAQVDVGGRGKAGGVLMADRDTVIETARKLFNTTIKGLPVQRILIEERLEIRHEYYVSITIDRTKKQPVILFAETGGIDIEETAKTDKKAIRSISFCPLLADVPGFLLRELCGDAPVEIQATVNRLYHVFCHKDALLAEINPLVTTPAGVYAADAKLIIDDNSLARQGIVLNRDLTEREREAEKHGFSYVELQGNIGVIGNGAGLTMATLDLIEYYGGRAADFLDVGGGADSERVMHAVRLVSGVPTVKVIVVNLLGGITRCDEVARGIIASGVPEPVIVRIAGTNAEEGRKLLAEKGYEMLDTMDLVVKKAVEVAS